MDRSEPGIWRDERRFYGLIVGDGLFKWVFFSVADLLLWQVGHNLKEA
jgi:hypothetical protein